jgi:Ribosomal protein L13e
VVLLTGGHFCSSEAKMKHNNVIVNAHFHKDWQNRVKTWFNQPGKKQSRRVAREKKMAKVFPRPTQLLRPVVHPPSSRYSSKVRLGRGFTLEELKVRCSIVDLFGRLFLLLLFVDFAPSRALLFFRWSFFLAFSPAPPSVARVFFSD